MWKRFLDRLAARLLNVLQPQNGNRGTDICLDEAEEGHTGFDSVEIVVAPVEDVIDLHHYRPSEVKMLLNEYFQVCREKGILDVRIIHGKGKGILRETVHTLLKRHDGVESFMLADPSDGGWGATVVRLKPLI